MMHHTFATKRGNAPLDVSAEKEYIYRTNNY